MVRYSEREGDRHSCGGRNSFATAAMAVAEVAVVVVAEVAATTSEAAAVAAAEWRQQESGKYQQR